MDRLTGETVELLQALIRTRCVNDGTAESGFETRNADILRQYLGSTGLDLQSFGPTPERPNTPVIERDLGLAFAHVQAAMTIADGVRRATGRDTVAQRTGTA